MKEENTRKPTIKLSTSGIIFRCALLIFILLLLSVHLMGSLYGKFASSGYGDANASVASFNVLVTGSPKAISVNYTTNEHGIYTFEISNNSDVAISYNISISANEALSPMLNTTNGKLATHTGPNTHTLSFRVNNWDAITEDMTNENPTFTCTFTIIIHVEQIN